jgi:hypothetical protein
MANEPFQYSSFVMEFSKHLLVTKCGVYFLEACDEDREINSYEATLQAFKILESLGFGKLETQYVEKKVLHRFIRVSDDILKESPILLEGLVKMGLKLEDVMFD